MIYLLARVFSAACCNFLTLCFSVLRLEDDDWEGIRFLKSQDTRLIDITAVKAMWLQVPSGELVKVLNYYSTPRRSFDLHYKYPP